MERRAARPRRNNALLRTGGALLLALLAGAAASLKVAAQGGTATQGDAAAQGSTPAQFDVVSIRRHTAGLNASGGIRDLPDGTMIMINQPIRSIIMGASPVPVREVTGLPDWATSERYDVTAKPPAGATRAQRAEMMRNMFAERMQLLGHVEQRERDTFALVVARSDGRLGPQLTPSALDCLARPAPGTPPPSGPPTGDPQGRCGMMLSVNSIVSGGIAMDQLVGSLTGLAGGLVNNRTGLQGFYALTLRYARPGGAQAPADVPAGDDLPEFFTAIQEQLGLKLQPEKTLVPVFVVDRLERPSEN